MSNTLNHNAVALPQVAKGCICCKDKPEFPVICKGNLCKCGCGDVKEEPHKHDPYMSFKVLKS